MGEQQLQEKQFDLLYEELRRIADELEVLRRLAEGKVYKQIALELELSTSTVRTHLHNVYGKLGAVDRAQAVLIASERGWL